MFRKAMKRKGGFKRIEKSYIRNALSLVSLVSIDSYKEKCGPMIKYALE
jgi:hypothetical protein